MLVDLHCHTLKTVSGDGNNRQVAQELFKEVIESNNIKIVAITNHNVFDLANYLSLSDAVKDECQVWPGIELTVEVKGKKGHMLIVHDPKYVDDFARTIKSLLGDTSPDDVIVKAESLKGLFDSNRVIYIIHYMGKAKSFSDNNLNIIQSYLKSLDTVFLEPSNSTTMGILLNHDYQSIIGSDVKDWKEYPIEKVPKLRLSVKDFASFRLLAKRQKQIVESLLLEKGELDVDVEKHWNRKINLYKDINIIFGGKGTGKSELLKEIKRDLIKKGDLKVNHFDSAISKETFSNLTKVTFKDDYHKFSDNDMSSEIEYIKTWKIMMP